MNIKLYNANKLKFDKYGYSLNEISMEYFYSETFLVYKFSDTNHNKIQIEIPSLNEVLIKNKDILRTAIELIKLFPDDSSTILSQLPDELVANNSSIFVKLDKGDNHYKSVLDDKIERYNSKNLMA